MDYKKEIKEIFKEYCKDNEIKFSKKDFKDFLKFLEIDIYDWVKENLRCYFRDNVNKK
jgi:Ca2+-binding EF-hand superfamily protein